MAERRALKFASLDEVMPDVERLLAGHVTVGRWSLGQICNHLRRPIAFSVGTPPTASEPTPEQAEARRQFFASDRFPEGRTAPPGLEPKPDLDAQAEADALRDAIARFASAPGPCATHPVLGPLTRDEWARFHCLHCAHHLSFAVPR